MYPRLACADLQRALDAHARPKVQALTDHERGSVDCGDGQEDLMPDKSKSVEEALGTILRAAADAGAHVVEATLSLDDAKVPVAGIDGEKLVALIRAVRPRIVYCASIPFDAGAQILNDLFGDDADEALLNRPRVKKLVAKWRPNDGQAAQGSAAVVVDGVVHGLVLDAPWYAEFEADIEAHGEETGRLRDERDRRAEAEAQKRLDPFVKALLADPRFSGPKVGRAKRLALAQDLFPDEDRQALAEAVDLAESRHWLSTGR